MLCGFVFGHNIIYVKDNKTSTRHCQPSLVPRPPTLLLPDPPPSCSPTSRPTFHSLHSYWLWGGEVGGGGEAVTTLSRIVVFFQQGCILFVCLLLLTCNILDSSLHCLQTILFSRNTALHFAAWRNWSEIVELLLVNGAKVSIVWTLVVLMGRGFLSEGKNWGVHLVQNSGKEALHQVVKIK